MATDLVYDSSFCKQRQLMQMFTIPLSRITPNNPYSSKQFTKMQLDMRRKAEILKYGANKSSSQTNNLTKKEAFAKLVSVGTRRSTAVIKSNQVTCPADDLVLTPTTSCDVPGPVMYLYEDKSVPLYNYSDFNSRTYPDYVPNNSVPWQFVVIPNILIPNTGTGNVYYLLINNGVDQPYYTYNITMPVGLTVAGSGSSTYRAQISDLSLMIYYNNRLVNRSFISDFSSIVTATITNPTSFNTTQFIGNAVFRNIQLYTEPTYVYSFVLTANIRSFSGALEITKTFSSVSLISNMSSASSSSSGCTVTVASTPGTYIGASISGQ